MLGGLLSVAFGVIMFGHPGAGAVALLALVAAFAFVTGVMQIAFALELRRVVAELEQRVRPHATAKPVTHGWRRRDANDRPGVTDCRMCAGAHVQRASPSASTWRPRRPNRERSRRPWRRHAGAALASRRSQRVSHLPLEPNPALVQQAQERAQSSQNRIADRITAFAGSMRFVYIHIVWFGCWIGFGVEHYPYGLLTMIVSLEAIFLSTFVMISQNRADAKRQADRRPAMADRPGRGQAERGAARASRTRSSS